MNKYLKPAQRDSAIRLDYILNSYKGAILRGEEGTGKTIIATQISEDRGNILWVAPAKDLKSIAGKVRSYQEEMGLARDDVFKFVSYQCFGNVNRMSIKELNKFDFIVFDECHNLRNWKNSHTQRFVRTHIPKYLFLSGTPMVKNPRDMIYVLRKCGLFKKQSTRDFDIFYFDAQPSQFGDFLERGAFQNEEHFQTNVDKVCHELEHKDINQNVGSLNIHMAYVAMDNPPPMPKDITKYTETKKKLGMLKAKAAKDIILHRIKENNIKTALILTHYHEVAEKVAKDLGFPLALKATRRIQGI